MIIAHRLPESSSKSGLKTMKFQSRLQGVQMEHLQFEPIEPSRYYIYVNIHDQKSHFSKILKTENGS